jgi:glutamine synthetase
MIALNTAMAEQLVIFKNEVDALIEEGIAKEDALVKILRKYIKYSKPIRFDGNGYSDEWKAEAEARGLDCESSAPIVFDRYLDKASIEMFDKMEVMTETELKARNEIKWEMYTKKVQIEARVLGDLALNHIVPTVMKYQSMLLDNIIKMETVLGKEEGDKYVYFVDGCRLFDGELKESCTVDGCHPNDLGERKMAGYIGSVLAEVIGK